MPHTTRTKVHEKVVEYWPDANPDDILSSLDQYGQEGTERGRARVQLAVLKLCEGDRSRLEDLVRMAKTDYRDVLAYAEYPEEMRLGFVGMRQLSKEEAEAVRRRDRQQYLEWLGG